VDYVRLAPDGQLLGQPFCYRDERTVATKEAADAILPPAKSLSAPACCRIASTPSTNCWPTPQTGVDPHAPWVMLPEYVLYWLGGRRVAEYTNATHTGLVDLKTGDWDRELFSLLDSFRRRSADRPRWRHPGPPCKGPGRARRLPRDPARRHRLPRHRLRHRRHSHQPRLHRLHLLRNLVAGGHAHQRARHHRGSPSTPATPTSARPPAQLCFHTLVNGMWLLKQCMDAWSAEGRAWEIEDLVAQAATSSFPGTIDVDAEPLLLDSGMPERINHQLWRRRWATIPDVAGNEPVFARVIFESLADRYASALASLEQMLGRKLERIHILGGASRNKLLTELTAQRTGLPSKLARRKAPPSATWPCNWPPAKPTASRSVPNPSANGPQLPLQELTSGSVGISLSGCSFALLYLCEGWDMPQNNEFLTVAAAHNGRAPLPHHNPTHCPVDPLQRFAGSFTPTARTLSATCSGREAPMIADATSGRRSTQASPSAPSSAPDPPRSASVANRPKQEIRPEMPTGRLHEDIHLFAGRAASRRRRLPRRIFSRQHSMRQRRKSQVPDPMPRTSRKDLPSGFRHSIEYCGWLDENAVSPLLPVIAAAASICSAVHSLKPMARTLPAAQPGPARQRLFQRRFFVVPVALVEIDHVHA
jgi:rhamnulokinase